MSKRRREHILFIEDILISIEKIERYTKGLNIKQLREKEMVVDAVVRNFEIIGEAVKNIPKIIRDKYPYVEWKEAAGFRDVLIHDYFGIDVDAVKDTLKNNLKPFKKHIIEVLKAEKTKD
jgi:uncharacterized protein with HEPN domain